MKILFAGLGRMGSPMAGHIANQPEHEVTVFNRSTQKVDEWLSNNAGQGYIATDTQLFDVLILCIGNDEDVRSTLTGNAGLLSRVKSGGVIIDHTTTSATLANEMFTVASQRSVAYLDAPVSGGEAGAINGQLSCMVGGDAHQLDKVRAVMSRYCKTIVHIGNSGAGQIAKMANQLCIAGTLAGLSEAIKLVEKSEVNRDQVLAAIQGGAAQSWQMDNRYSTMTKREFDFGFAIDHMIKDLGYALQHGDALGFNAEISKQVLQWYKDLSNQGRNTQDTSCLIEHYSD